MVGYNDIDLAALAHPPSTTVSASACEMSMLAMTMLRQLQSGLPVEPSRIVLDTELVVRSSSGC